MGAVVGEPHVGRHVERGADAEEAVESVRERAVGEGLGEVDVFEVRAGAGPVEAEVPFAKGGGRVAVVAEETRDGRATGLDERRVVALEDALFQTSAPGVAAGEERVARGSAERGGGVRVGEAQALAGEAVEVRGRPRAAWVVTGDVADPEIVGENVDDVRRSRGAGGDEEQDGGEECANHLEVLAGLGWVNL